ncbi:potassium channel family protein [Shimazuella kribbensis]|uniref:potassium channel family protein n=1 Tax=Shimazuella kribbensis TaxID=139808 RepID=UPI000425F5E2|nr:TrkA family potassium uptake protein [Shimazuella kribbensis]
MKNTQFAVFGLGRFGGSLVKEFHENGIEVLAVDTDQKKVDEFVKYAVHAVQVPDLDETILNMLDITSFDHVFVSFGENIEGSILLTLLLKEMGVKKVWVKASSDNHQKVLNKIGADQVIHPERDMAKRIANYISSKSIIDYIELSSEHSIVEIVASPKIYNKTLADLDTRNKYGCNIIAIKRDGVVKISLIPNELIQEGDILVVIGRKTSIKRFEEEGV